MKSTGGKETKRGIDPPAASNRDDGDEDEVDLEVYDVENPSKVASGNVASGYVTTRDSRARGRVNTPVNAKKADSVDVVATAEAYDRNETEAASTVQPIMVEVLSTTEQPPHVSAVSPEPLEPASYPVNPPPPPKRASEAESERTPTTEESKRRRKILFVAAGLLLVAVIVGVVVPLVMLRPKGITSGAEEKDEGVTPGGNDVPDDEDSATEKPEEPGTVPSVTELVALFSQKNTETSKSLQDKTSSQYRGIDWLSKDVSANSYKLPPDEERIVQRGSLAIFFYSTLGDKEWNNSTGWLEHSVSECEWYGVTCNADDVVDNLIFGGEPPNNSLAGTLPREVSFLEQLMSIDLYKNNVGGTFPSELAKLSRLEMFNAGDNKLTGTLPPEIWQMNSLWTLRLWENQLKGPLPTGLGRFTNIVDIKLNDNMLTGTIPTEIGLWTKVQNWSASNNLFTGTLPSELSQCVFLEIIKLNDNLLTGQVPSELGLLKGLVELNIHSNRFTGTMPAEICAINGMQDMFADCLGEPPEIACECCTQCWPSGTFPY